MCVHACMCERERVRMRVLSCPRPGNIFTLPSLPATQPSVLGTAHTAHQTAAPTPFPVTRWRLPGRAWKRVDRDRPRPGLRHAPEPAAFSAAVLGIGRNGTSECAAWIGWRPLSTHLGIHSPVHPSGPFIRPFSVLSFLHPSSFLSIHLSIYLFIHPCLPPSFPLFPLSFPP